MIRPFIPLDVFRCAFLGESEKFNRAYTLGSLLSKRPSTRSILEASFSGLGFRRTSRAWVWHEGNRINALIGAGQRSGPQSWEITHLFFRNEIEHRLTTLFDRVGQAAASHGGEKVFIRLLRGDPLIDVARLSGYFPLIPETLYIRDQDSRLPGSAVSSSTKSLVVLPKAQEDDHGLFRLYNASTPAEVRYAFGMTIDQWMASIDRGRGRASESVVKHKGEVKAWLRTTRRFGLGEVSATIHPDYQSDLPELVDAGLSDLGGVGRIYCLAPEYQVTLRRALSDSGFEPTSDYVTLVKKMTLTTENKARVRVAAPTG